MARALSIGYHTITLRKQLAAMAQAAMVWMYYRSQAVVESTLYLVERISSPTLIKKYGAYVLRKLLFTTATGEVSHITNSPRLTRKESLFRYLLATATATATITRISTLLTLDPIRSAASRCCTNSEQRGMPLVFRKSASICQLLHFSLSPFD